MDNRLRRRPPSLDRTVAAPDADCGPPLEKSPLAPVRRTGPYASPSSAKGLLRPSRFRVISLGHVGGRRALGCGRRAARSLVTRWAWGSTQAGLPPAQA